MEALSVSRVARDGVAAVTRDHAAFDLKGVVTPVTVIRLRSRDTNLVDRQLRAKVAQFPQLFRDSPVVIDLEALGGDPGELSLAGLVHLMKACRVVPVGVSHLDPARLDEAAVAGIGVIRLGAERPEIPSPEEVPEPVAEKAAPAPAASAEAPVAPKMVFAHRPPLVVKTPVRSGQIVYAQATDLIVLAPVNPGAQIVADGHIHCYAHLRGRALAGAQGYAEARIFCQKLEAEMVSIAGAYLISDQIPELRRGKSAQIHLVHGECIVDTL